MTGVAAKAIRRRYLMGLLAGLLVFAQVVLAAHEVHHLDHDDDPAACGYCVVGGDIKHGVAATASLYLAHPGHTLNAGSLELPGPAPCTPLGVARGPPA